MARRPFGLSGLPWQRRDASPGNLVYRWIVRIAIAIGLAMFNVWVIAETISLFHLIAADTQASLSLAMAHGRWFVSIEQRLHSAIEPAVQHRVLAGVSTPFGTLSGATLRAWVVWIYSNAVPTWLLATLVWSYLFTRRWFGMLRDVTIISLIGAVALYRAFPVAPPRFVLAGPPSYLQDWTHGSGSIATQLANAVGFDPLAAFPSVHLLWALLPALCLIAASRHPWMWLAAALYPAVMAFAVIASANHYVIDCVGALLDLGVALLLALAIDRGRRLIAQRIGKVPRPDYPGANLPAVVWLCLICAGVLTSVGTPPRLLVALAILLLIVGASTYNLLPTPSARARRSRRVDALHFAAGWLFVAGIPVATPLPGLDGLLCSLAWLLACVAAVVAHADDRRRFLPHTHTLIKSNDQRSLI